MANISKNILRLMAVFACPVLAFLGLVFFIAGEILSLSFVAQAGESLLSVSLFLLLPVGLCCLAISWRMARAVVDPKHDAGDLIEFLLGFGGFLMVVLGAVFSPIWQWIADLT
jgi:hypothetical protein